MVGDCAAKSRGAVPLVGVAAIAGRISGSQIVVVVDMAIGAGGGDVRASQRESGSAVIEIGGAPSRSRVTVGAIG